MEKFICVCGKEFENIVALKHHQISCKICRQAKIDFYIKEIF